MRERRLCAAAGWLRCTLPRRSASRQSLIDQVFSVLVPQALGLPLDAPLAPLEEAPLSQTLGGLKDRGATPAALLGATGEAHFELAWAAARSNGIVPDEPFDPSRFRAFSYITLSGGACRATNVRLLAGCACEVQWAGGADVWQPLPSAADSDNDSEGDDAGAGVHAGGAGPRGPGRGRRGADRRAVGRGGAVAAGAAGDDDSESLPPRSRGAGTRGRPAPSRRGLARSASRGRGAAAAAAAAASSSDESGSLGGRRQAARGARGRGRAGRRGRGSRGPGSLLRRASKSVSSVSGSDGAGSSGSISSGLNAGRAVAASQPDEPCGAKRSRGASLGSSTDTGRSSGSSGCARAAARAGGDPSSSEGDSGDARAAAADAGACPRDAPLRPTRPELKAVSSDRRLRRRLSCDPVVSLQLVFDYSPQRGGAASASAAAAAASPALQLVFAYEYEAVPELDAFTELGSRDYSVRECAARGRTILPVSSMLRPRRNVPVPKDQLPLDWLQVVAATGRSRLPEYIWFQ